VTKDINEFILRTNLLAYIPYFEKIKVGLWDHVAVCVCVCVCVSPLPLPGNSSVKIPLSLLDNGSVKIPVLLQGNGSVETHFYDVCYSISTTQGP
jgi:hypothetical protein